MQKVLNDQVNAEMYSAYLYLAMSAHCTSISLNGFANWMHVQAQEEMVHAMKIYDFINERDGRVELAAIAAPPGKWQTPLKMFEAVYKHEQKVTGLINNLVNIAIKGKDHATNNFLQWFVAEQVEEESSAKEIVDKLKLIKNDSNGLFMLDKELAARIFTPPADAGTQQA
jgi:ferritin